MTLDHHVRYFPAIHTSPRRYPHRVGFFQVDESIFEHQPLTSTTLHVAPMEIADDLTVAWEEAKSTAQHGALCTSNKLTR